jgi:hypothetical protein
MKTESRFRSEITEMLFPYFARKIPFSLFVETLDTKPDIRDYRSLDGLQQQL